MTTKNLKFFFIYQDNRKDTILQADLNKHISGIVNSEDVFWVSDSPNCDQEEAQAKLVEANIIGLLISSDFISLYRQQDTLSFRHVVEFAIQGHRDEKFHLVPILICPVHGWQEALKLQDDIQFLPKEGKAVKDSSWTKDNAFVSVAQSIGELVDELKEYQQRLNKYFLEALNLIQQVYPEINDISSELREIQISSNIKETDASLIISQILQCKEEGWKNYTDAFILSIEREYPISDDSRRGLQEVQKRCCVTDKEVALIEEPILQKFLQHQPEAARSSVRRTQNVTFDPSLMIGIVAMLFAGAFAVVYPRYQSMIQPLFSEKSSAVSLETGQFSKIDGWIWLGDTSNNSGDASTKSPLDVSANIRPFHIPLRGEVVTVIRKVNLRNNGEDKIGEIPSGEELVILKTQAVPNLNSISPVNRIWAEVHRCGQSCKNAFLNQ
jgi:hypothetical protein